MKVCLAPQCMSPVFSNHYCLRHQNLRTDSKYQKKQAEKKYKQYHPEKKIVRKLDFGFKSESDMFYKIWDERSHICQFTGEDLSSLIFRSDGLWFSCFMHILSKGKYPLFRLNANNIVLGSPEFHRIVDQGTVDDRLKHPQWDWGTWDRLVVKKKEEYSKFLKDNLL
jgi:hypothetical protein